MEKEAWADQGKDGWARFEEPQLTKAQYIEVEEEEEIK